MRRGRTIQSYHAWYGKYCKLLVYAKCFGSTEEELNILRKGRESFTKNVTLSENLKVKGSVKKQCV